jgi:hypothetical protein
MVLRNDWKTQQLDYVLAFPQAPAEQELYMKIPRGIKVESKTEYLRLNKICMDRSKPEGCGTYT